MLRPVEQTAFPLGVGLHLFEVGDSQGSKSLPAQRSSEIRTSVPCCPWLWQAVCALLCLRGLWIKCAAGNSLQGPICSQSLSLE